ncbi:MAG TPA: DUF2065 domain-containing protein [Dongiaceae bacterium]|jgi:uncharacterized protein YjeT (DUF2065 family)|nr:DUF2065 domain-containing protein [Dongiaceae bacterium]
MLSTGLADLVTALGLVLVIEGLVLALLPGPARRMVAELMTKPLPWLRLSGLASMAVGVIVVWLVRG